MSNEQWIILALSLATNIAIAVWALVKNLAPEWSKAKILSTQDEREHRQKMEQEGHHYSIIQQAWQDDRLSTLLEENESFIRERVWEKLEHLVADVRKTEMTLAQTRDTLALLCQEMAEIKDRLK